MPNAVTATPVKTLSANASSAGSSVASAAGNDAASLAELSSRDFAALLMGQLFAAPGETSSGTALADEAAVANENPGILAVDPAQLLAEMGLGAAMNPLNDTRASAEALSLATSKTRTDLESGPPALNASSLLQPDGKPVLNSADAEGAEPASGLGIGTSALATGGETAKVAGFAQQLGEANANLNPAPHAQAAEAPPVQNIPAPQMSAANRSAGENLRVETPVRDQSWSTDFGQKVVWLATQDKQAAQITLNPPQLGPIEISLSMKNDQATAVFASPHAEVREAIETALPRLREMLAGVGIELGQANVSAESFRQAQDNPQQGRSSPSATGDDQANGGSARLNGIQVGATSMLKGGNGLVDTFA